MAFGHAGPTDNPGRGLTLATVTIVMTLVELSSRRTGGTLVRRLPYLIDTAFGCDYWLFVAGRTFGTQNE
jgi:hypothetical protein